MKKSKSKIQIRFPNSKDLSNDAVVALCNLINAVYESAESGMWQSGAQRINEEKLKKMLINNELLLAETEGKIVGCVNINLLDDEIAEFGMLVADANYRGLGIGSALIIAAEKWALEKNRHIMQLELLTPKNWQHPMKEFLKSWYSRIGYQPQFVEPFEKNSPEQAKKLATKCDFTIYYKKLK